MPSPIYVIVLTTHKPIQLLSCQFHQTMYVIKSDARHAACAVMAGIVICYVINSLHRDGHRAALLLAQLRQSDGQHAVFGTGCDCRAVNVVGQDECAAELAE